MAAQIEGAKSLKHDLIAHTSALEMGVDDDGVARIDVHAQGMAGGSYPVRPIAHSQIGERLAIPAKYYNRLLAGTPADRGLLASNVNHWFATKPEKRMIRTLGGDVRAFLSNRYQRIDHEEIASVALPILAEIPDVKIVSCQMTEARLYIQAVAPRISGEVKVGDRVQAGVIISNSEVGLGSVSVRPLIYRLACLNGMIIADGAFRAYHVGRQIEDNAALWADDTKRADDRAVLLKVRDMVRASVDDVRFAETVGRMSELTEQRVTGDPAKAVEVLGRKVGASESERGGILRSLIEGADLSAWGLLNAVTHQAHTVKDYDRSIEFEEAGGAVLSMSRKDWREILEAA
ncbi:DUF932 domain-containing protein [Rhodopseudomonas faecalis]|uniref:DUF932 domain-containing protein n=1 Tax=Rhodopseudomonas faecalis TaxID=99655 RepID=UPI001AECF3A8|nr:DUF932 domain-containing protein [Rhodopseudomonas faecalis]